MKNLLIIKRVLLALFVVGILLFNIPFPIHKEVSALEIKLDDSIYQQFHTVSIDGAYRFNLFGNNTFCGQISTPAYPLTYEKMDTVWFYENHEGSLDYTYSTTEKDEYGHYLKDMYLFGHIITKPLLGGRTIVLLFEQYKGADGCGGTWSPEDGRCLVIGAQDRAAALKTLAYYDIFGVN